MAAQGGEVEVVGAWQHWVSCQVHLFSRDTRVPRRCRSVRAWSSQRLLCVDIDYTFWHISHKAPVHSNMTINILSPLWVGCYVSAPAPSVPCIASCMWDMTDKALTLRCVFGCWLTDLHLSVVAADAAACSDSYTWPAGQYTWEYWHLSRVVWSAASSSNLRPHKGRHWDIQTDI